MEELHNELGSALTPFGDGGNGRKTAAIAPGPLLWQFRKPEFGARMNRKTARSCAIEDAGSGLHPPSRRAERRLSTAPAGRAEQLARIVPAIRPRLMPDVHSVARLSDQDAVTVRALEPPLFPFPTLA